MTPSGWTNTTLGEVSEIRRGASPRPISDPKWFSEDGPGWVRIVDVTRSDRFLRATDQKLSREGAAKSVRIAPGDLIMSICATIGRPVISAIDACIHDGFVLFDKVSDQVDKNFLYYLLQDQEARFDSLGQPGTQKNLNTSIVKQTSLCLPPIPEQKKIAAVLGSVDDAIQATQAVIDQTRKVKADLVEKLLLSFGKEGCSEYLIGDLVTVASGVSVNGEDRTKLPGEFGVLKISAVTYGKFDPMEHKTILPEDLQRAKLNPRKNTILMSRANTATLVGASVFVDQDHSDVFLPDKLWQLSVTDPASVSVRWLAYILASKSVRARLSDLATGTSASMKNISKAKFLSLSVSVPPRQLQDQMVSTLNGIDLTEDISIQRLEVLMQIKQGLMADLLAGHKRVEVSA